RAPCHASRGMRCRTHGWLAAELGLRRACRASTTGTPSGARWKPPLRCARRPPRICAPWGSRPATASTRRRSSSWQGGGLRDPDGPSRRGRSARGGRGAARASSSSPGARPPRASGRSSGTSWTTSRRGGSSPRRCSTCALPSATGAGSGETSTAASSPRSGSSEGLCPSRSRTSVAPLEVASMMATRVRAHAQPAPPRSPRGRWSRSSSGPAPRRAPSFRARRSGPTSQRAQGWCLLA
ncbi:unnamed protein product, partial [Prorocentrum cordatum]